MHAGKQEHPRLRTSLQPWSSASGVAPYGVSARPSIASAGLPAPSDAQRWIRRAGAPLVLLRPSTSTTWSARVNQLPDVVSSDPLRHLLSGRLRGARLSA